MEAAHWRWDTLSNKCLMSWCVQGLSHDRAASALWLRHQEKIKICGIGQTSSCSGLATHTVCQQRAARPFPPKSGSASATKWCESVSFVRRVTCFTESRRRQHTHTILQHFSQMFLFLATYMDERLYYGKWGWAACQQCECQMLYFQQCVGPCLPLVNSLFTTSKAWEGGGSAFILAAINKEGSLRVGMLAKAITHWSGSDSALHLTARILAQLLLLLMREVNPLSNSHFDTLPKVLYFNDAVLLC